MHKKNKLPWVVGCMGFGLLLAAMPVHALDALSLEHAFNDPAVWELTPEGAVQRWSPYGFEWMEQIQKSTYRWYQPKRSGSGADGSLRALPEKPLILVHGEVPVEVVIKFQGQKLAGMMALLYSRGDSGDLRMQDFAARAQSLIQKLNAWAGASGAEQKGDGRGGGAVIERRIWTRDGTRVDLEWGYTRLPGNQGRPEFVRLRTVPFDAAQRAQVMGGKMARENVAPSIGIPDGIAGAIEMKKRVEKRANGDLLVSVPMVDQGAKGYCVAAVLERVARFYGREFDQHEAAQMADTTATEGTSSDKLVEGLRKMAGLMKMRCVGRTDMDDTATFLDNKRRIQLTVPKEFSSMLKIYNKEAKKAGSPEYEVWAALDAGGIQGVYAKLDKSILRKARLAQKVEAGRFEADVVKNISVGAPVVWSVLTGLVQEEGLPPSAPMSGHMRIIMGVNTKSREILYTDSWGPGHEEKRMSMDDAWVINKGYFVVTPQNVRF